MPTLIDFLEEQASYIGFRANFVVDKHGHFVGATGSSRDITNQADKALLIRLRSLANVIVTDAATAANEGYAPSKWAPIQVWSKSGNFRGIEPKGTLTIHKIDDLPKALEDLARECDSVLLETGPTLTKQIAAMHKIGELKLTVIGAGDDAQAQAVSTATRDSLGLAYLDRSAYFKIEENHFFTFGR